MRRVAMCLSRALSRRRPPRRIISRGLSSSNTSPAVDLNYRIAFQGKDLPAGSSLPKGDRIPIIMMHGLLGSLSNLRALSLAPAVLRDRPVVRVDLRNHGESPHSPDASSAAMAADLIKLMDRLGAPAAHVLGHSLGGRVAMQTGLDYPSRVASLVIADMAPASFPPPETLPDSPTALHTILDAMKSIELAELSSRDQASKAMAERVPNDMIRGFALMNLARAAGGKGFRWKCNLPVLRSSLNRWDNFEATREAGAAFEGPALFLAGGDSDYVQEKHLPAIEDLFPDGRVVWVPAAGHWLHADKPKEVAQEVAEFIDSID